MLNFAIVQAQADAFIDKHSFDQQIKRFILVAQDVVNQHFKDMDFHTKPPTLKMQRGFRYVKVVREGPGELSVHCFVEIATGFILKAASYMSPAKGVRGSIWDGDCGRAAMTPYGARYMR